MTKALRTCLWNVFVSRVFGKVSCNRDGIVSTDYHIFISLWKNFFKLPLDEYERDLAERKAWYRDFFEAQEWNKIFDLLEFVSSRMTFPDAREFTQDVNTVFEQEQVGYRLAGGKIIAVDATTTAEVLEAVFHAAKVHSHDALEKAYARLFETMSRDGKFEGAKTKALLHDILSECDIVLAPQKLNLAEARTGVSKLLELQDVSQECFEMLMTVVNAYVRCAFERAVQLGILSPLERSTLKSSNPDPWGERKV